MTHDYSYEIPICDNHGLNWWIIFSFIKNTTSNTKFYFPGGDHQLFNVLITAHTLIMVFL